MADQKTALGGPRKNKFPTPQGRRSALIIVDVQDDFTLPTGSLSVADAPSIVPLINRLRNEVGWDVIALSQDWHAEGHVSFYSTHIENPAAALYQPLELPSGEKQVMWPDHCVQGSTGAQFHKELEIESTDYVVQKGTKLEVDSYSAFFDNDHKSQTKLASILEANDITDVYVVGLASDFCVGYTALDARSLGFNTYLIEDAARGVASDSTEAMKVKLSKAGVQIIQSPLLLDNKTQDPRQQAATYLAKHGIDQLLQKLCTQLVFHKPEDPNLFLIEKLKQIQATPGQDIGALSLFEAKDYDTVFGMMDPMGSGEISQQQLLKALADMDILSQQTRSEIEGTAKASYTVEEFRTLAHQAAQ